MCLSFPFMQLTLSSHQPLPFVMAFVDQFLLSPRPQLVKMAFACLGNILCKSCSVVRVKGSYPFNLSVCACVWIAYE